MIIKVFNISISYGIFTFFIFVLTLFLIKKRDNLLLALCFFAPFCECGVLAFPFFTLQAGHFFLVLYLLAFLWNNKGFGVLKFRRPSLYLSMYLVIAVISILAAVLLRTNVQVYGIGNGVSLTGSKVDSQNFTQLIYLIVGMLVYAIVYNFCIKDYENWRKIVRLCVLSGCAVLLIGFYQLIANKYGLPFTSIFRISNHSMWQQLSRVQSTMAEASYLGQYITIIFAILISGFLWTEKRSINFIVIIFLLAIGVMTRSSTFFVGVVSVMIMYGFFQKKGGTGVLKYIGAIVIAFGLFFYLYKANPYVTVLINNTIAKFRQTTISGITRKTVIMYMFGVFLKNPILGVGFGGGRSSDVYTTILSTTGLLGFVSFSGFFIRIFVKLFPYRADKDVFMSIMVEIAFLVTALFVPEMNYLHYWVFFGVIHARCYYCENKMAVSKI